MSSKSFWRRACASSEPTTSPCGRDEFEQRVEQRAELRRVGQVDLEVCPHQSRCARSSRSPRGIPRTACSTSTHGVNGAACRCSKQAARVDHGVARHAARAPPRAGASCRRRPRPRRGPCAPSPRRASSQPLPSSSQLWRAGRTAAPCLGRPPHAAVDWAPRASLLLEHADRDRLLLALHLHGRQLTSRTGGARAVQELAADERLAGRGGAISRAARLTASPMTVYWRRNGGPTSPAKTWPPFTPICVLRSSPASRSPAFRSRRETRRVGGGVLVGHRRAEGDDELRSLRGDVAADDEAAMLGREPGEHRDVALQLLERRVERPALSMISLRPRMLTKTIDDAPVLGREHAAFASPS